MVPAGSDNQGCTVIRDQLDSLDALALMHVVQFIIETVSYAYMA